MSLQLCALPALDEKFPLLLGHLLNQAFEFFPFFDPLLDLGSQMFGHIKRSCLFAFFPSQQGGFMNGAFLRATAFRISALLAGDRQRTFQERLRVAQTIQETFASRGGG